MPQNLPFQDNTFEEDNQAIRDALAAIGRKYEVIRLTENEEAQIQEQLSRFESFTPYANVFLYGAARIQYNSEFTYFTVVSLNYQPQKLTAYEGDQAGLTEFAYVGLTKFDNDYDSVFIRPESTTERLIELVYPTNIKFEADKDFHKKYRVIAEDETRFKDQVTEAFLATIRQYDGLEIEIKGHDFMVRLPKGLSVEVAEDLGDFLVKIGE